MIQCLTWSIPALSTGLKALQYYCCFNRIINFPDCALLYTHQAVFYTPSFRGACLMVLLRLITSRLQQFEHHYMRITWPFSSILLSGYYSKKVHLLILHTHRSLVVHLWRGSWYSQLPWQLEENQRSGDYWISVPMRFSPSPMHNFRNQSQSPFNEYRSLKIQ